MTGLFVYSCSVSPRDARIGELGQDDIGAFVRIRGHVRSVTTVGSGGVRVDMLDYADYSSISAYLSAKVFHSLDYSANIKPGAFLELAGEVEVFNGRVEVSVQKGESVKLLARVDDNII